MKISIITLFHNRKDVSREFLEYWRRDYRRSGIVELIFGDSLSTDGTRELLESYASLGKVHLFEENVGFAVGNNQLAAMATGDVLIFLNNDTIPCEGWLKELSSVLSNRPDAGVVGNIQLAVGSRLVDHAGKFFTVTGSPYHFRPAAGSLDRLRWMPVPAVTGACMAIRKEFFDDLGGFDERYVNGYEDTDLCLRVRDRGKDILVSTRSQIWHYVASSPGRHRFEKQNEERFMKRWNTVACDLGNWTPPDLSRTHNRRSLPVEQSHTVQIFYPSPIGFNEQDSCRQLLECGRWKRMRMTLPKGALSHSRTVRLDPSTTEGKFEVGGVSLRDTKTCRLVFHAAQPLLRAHVFHGGTATAIEGRPFILRSIGNDPQLYLQFPETTAEPEAELTLSLWIRAIPAPAPENPVEFLERPHVVRRILVDLWRLSPGGANGGVKVLVFEILKGLQRRLGQIAEITIVHGKDLRSELEAQLPGIARAELIDAAYHKPDQGWLRSFDVLYSPLGYSGLRDRQVPSVSLIVDLLHRDRPDLLPAPEVRARERQLVEILATSHGVQCNSHFVRASLRHHYGIAESHLFVAYNSLQFRLGARLRKAPRPYFLYPANTWRHKNHEVLLQAYAKYRTRAPSPWELHLTGTRVGGENEGLPDDRYLPTGVRWLGYLDEEDYFERLASAGALVFPSLYEGFGIPVLEALKLGVPIACSNRGSLIEVAGEKALYFDPTSVTQIQKALVEISTIPVTVASISSWTPNDESRFDWNDTLERIAAALRCAPKLISNTRTA